MLSNFLSKLLTLTCGTLYPAYRSYKAVRSKNVREYVKWMMYWIVFALFLNVEVVADIFIGIWLPFYYECKILFLLWLISPYTRGASFLYRKFVHPLLVRHEKDIDDYLVQAKEHGYTAIVGLGSRGFMYAREIVASAAVKGQLHLVKQLRKSYSVGDLSRSDDEHEADDGSEQHQQRAWQGYYDDGGRIVEEEFQYLYSDDNAGPKSRPALRQSTRRAVTTRSIASGYSTLPRRRRRDGTL